MSQDQEAAYLWVDVFERLQNGEKDVPCPTCNVGKMSKEELKDDNGTVIEVLIVCNADPEHRNYVLLGSNQDDL